VSQQEKQMNILCFWAVGKSSFALTSRRISESFFPRKQQFRVIISTKKKMFFHPISGKGKKIDIFPSEKKRYLFLCKK